MLEAQIKQELLAAAMAYGRDGQPAQLERIRQLTALLDNRRSAFIQISSHAISRYMQRSGAKNRGRAENTLKKMIDSADEMELKDRWKAIQLINHNFRDATYLKYQCWLLVVANDTLVTCHHAEARRWRKLDAAWQTAKAAACA